MSAPRPTPTHSGFPRFFNIGGAWVNSYKVFLIVGIYVGSLVSAAVAERSGVSPLRIGLAAAACAIAGLIGARVYHLLLYAPRYLEERSLHALWDSTRGGWSVFGALLTFIPCLLGAAWALHVPVAVFGDYSSAGVLAGGFWIRLGCVFNGCCGGREIHGWLGVRLHDINGVRKRRIPVQFIEMVWWLLGGAVFLALWPSAFPSGSHAVGVLGWYGLGRFFLEPLREHSDLIFGTVRIDRVVAGALALVAGAALVILTLPPN